MTWLEFCQRHWPTYPWQRDGCKLIPFTEQQIKDFGTPDFGNSPEKWKFWSGSMQVTTLRGCNPHGQGKLHVDRMAIVKDVPFWAVKWLVFERDKTCQGCGTKGWQPRTVWIPSKHKDQWSLAWGQRKQVWDVPLDEEFYHPPTPDYSLGMDVHHIVPVKKGGSNCTHNTLLLCWKCHDSLDGHGGLPTKLDGLQLKLNA